MPRSRLRWRALAVLGALLSVMLDWPIGFAMPAVNNQHIQIMTKIHSCTSAGSRNCSVANYLNLTNSDRVTDRGGDQSSSSDSGRAESPNSDSKSSPKHDQNSPVSMLSSLSTIDQRIIANSNRSIRPDRLMRIYNKRKRKKSVARLTADQLRSIRTHNLSSSSDVNNLIDINNNNNNNNNISENQVNSSRESISLSNSVTELITNELIASATVHSIVDNTTVSRYLSRTDRSVKLNSQINQRKVNDSNLDRNERSANLSHTSGPAKKIQLFIKNRFIQVLPDGTINGTQDDLSDYTILQRTTVDVGQIKIQGVATCLFLCMDQCGAVYGSKSFTDDCVFNESMGQHHYNTYSSTYNSNSRTLYLALDRYGVPRKVIIPRTRSLEKLATYTKAMTADVHQDRVETLIARTFGANRVKHGLRQLCDAGKPLIELTASVMRPRPKCNIGQTAASAATVSEKLSRLSNNHNSSNNSSISGSHSKPSSNNNGNVRKKKKKRRCRPTENEQEHNCHKPRAQALKKRAQNRKCAQKLQECANARNKKNNGGNGKKQKGANQAGHKKRKMNGSGGGSGGNRKGKTSVSTTQTSSTFSTTPTTTTSAEGMETSTATATTITTLRSANTQTNRRKSLPQFSNEEEVSTEDSQQSSTETHESGDDNEDDDSSISSLGGHAQLVNGDDFLYDDDFDV